MITNPIAVRRVSEVLFGVVRETGQQNDSKYQLQLDFGNPLRSKQRSFRQGS